MKIATTFALTTAAVAVLSGCGRDEPEVITPVVMEEPIYAKDGTIVAMRPVVGHSGSDMSDGSTTVMDGDSDDDDDDDDG